MEAIAAIDRAVVARLERNLAVFSACGADSVKHLTVRTTSAAVRVVLACITAGLATLGLVIETLFCVELLLSGGECELLSTVLAYDSFVLEHEIPLKK